MMKQHIKKVLIFFFDLKVNLHLVLGKNNLRIILGSKSKTFKNIKARKKIGILIKKCVCCVPENLFMMKTDSSKNLCFFSCLLQKIYTLCRLRMI